ncbi:MAG: lipid-A-disaccharide synthase [Verrucomicrobiota bacterium]
MEKRLYVVAGELSGDLHGAGLLTELGKMVPGLKVRGVGGAAMKRATIGETEDWLEDAAVMGFWEVLKRYPWFRERFFRMLAELKEFRPEVLLLIDYPGFNLRFAEAVKRECPETKIVYYISPQVWAWKKGRIPKMARLIDELMCLFPFEQPLLAQAGLKTTFSGHPLVDELEESRIPDVRRESALVGLFPGSREHEVERLFPLMIRTAVFLREWRADLKFEVPAASEKLAARIRAMLAEAEAETLVKVTDGQSHALMQRATCAVVASGTATLEAAWYGLPYCLVYRVAPLTYALAKILVKIKWIGLVNILAGREVVREFVQGAAQPEAVATELRGLLESAAKREALQSDLADTVAKLGGPGAHRRAAEITARWLGADAAD